MLLFCEHIGLKVLHELNEIIWLNNGKSYTGEDKFIHVNYAYIGRCISYALCNVYEPSCKQISNCFNAM